jgi:hypothetical protein
MAVIGNTRTEAYNKINSILERLTYKPNVRIKCLHSSTRDSIEILLSGSVPDADQPAATVPWDQPTITVVSIYTLAPQFILSQSEDALIHLLWHHVRKWEDHEAMEFFKIDGKHFKDPHPELKRP